jgi:hypothetical protein
MKFSSIVQGKIFVKEAINEFSYKKTHSREGSGIKRRKLSSTKIYMIAASSAASKKESNFIHLFYL